MSKLIIKETSEGIFLANVEDFDVEQTLSCGQCFRWEKEVDGSFTGIAFGKVLNIKKTGEGVFLLSNSNLAEFDAIWRKYFDFDRDYGKIKSILSKDDEIMRKAVAFGGGIRLLNQDPWEILISYIISANNSIPNISRIIKKLSEKYGNVLLYRGKTYYSFPSVNQLLGENVEALKECRAGFRCKYIAAAIELAKNGQIDFAQMGKMNYEKAKQELMKIPGVGPKVADCIALFSLGKYDAYPVDVWVKRVTEDFYLKKDSKLTEIAEFAKKKFGSYAGFAQEYLFYYVRNGG